jgi:hypothetical protein
MKATSRPTPKIVRRSSVERPSCETLAQRLVEIIGEKG